MPQPKRKKSKPNTLESIETTAPEQTQIATAQSSASATAEAETATGTNPRSPRQLPDRSSWYSSWRSSSKALPATAQIARESISVAQGATSSAFESSRPPVSVSKVMRGSRKSIPLAAEATRVHATSDLSDKSRARASSAKEDGEKEPVKAVKEEEQPVGMVIEAAKLPPEPSIDVLKAADVGKGPWFAWWSRPDGYGSEGETSNKRQKLDIETATSTPLPGTPSEEPAAVESNNAMDVEGINLAADSGRVKPPEMKALQSSQRGWFGIWSSTENQQAGEVASTGEGAQQPPDITVSSDANPTTLPESNSPNGTTSKEPQTTSTSSGWAFWSTDKAKDPVPTPGGTQKQIGELAVADTPSQSHPEAAQFNEQRDDVTKSTVAKLDPRRTGSLLRPKRGTATKDPQTSDSSAVPTPLVSSSAAQTPTSEIPSPSYTPPLQELDAAIDNATKLPQKGDPTKPLTLKNERPNLILPSFDATYQFAPNPGYIERLSNYLAQSLHLPGSQLPSSRVHVHRRVSPPPIKKAVALGIHGFFPGALIQKFIGQPKGTSVRFANYAAAAVKSWCEQHQPDIKTVEIEKVALEGEGYIADRVITLWKLLLNWLGHLRQADFIFIACHSQGVPVAMMLVAKLIQLGCLAPNVRVGICAMAGINCGPFLEYRSRFFSGTALELFEFADSKSTVSRAYAESLELCLRHGVRVTFIGSIDDQLVSLESSLHTPVQHPYVNRAVFVDGRLHAPNFLTHLVIFAAKLRNLGISDHGLVRELSAPLAGSIVGGEGHSRIYDDPAVYQLAVQFALESTDVQATTTTAQPSPAKSSPRRGSADLTSTLPTSPALAQSLRRSSITLSPTTNLFAPSPNSIAPIITPFEPLPSSAMANPFYLPWAVRGMLEEEPVKKDEVLREQVKELVREFEEWRPASKVLRDVRWRLEGVRGMI